MYETRFLNGAAEVVAPSDARADRRCARALAYNRDLRHVVQVSIDVTPKHPAVERLRDVTPRADQLELLRDHERLVKCCAVHKRIERPLSAIDDPQLEQKSRVGFGITGERSSLRVSQGKMEAPLLGGAAVWTKIASILVTRRSRHRG